MCNPLDPGSLLDIPKDVHASGTSCYGWRVSADASSGPGLRTRDLPDVETMTRHIAVDAALMNASLNRVGGPRAGDTGEPGDTVLVPPHYTGAQPHGWYYSDGGGSWAQLIQLTGGRALLAGFDRDVSFGYSGEEDPRQGLPEWAAQLLPWRPRDRQTRHVQWWTVAALYDGQQWWEPDTDDAGVELSGLEMLAAGDECLQQYADDSFSNYFFGVDLSPRKPPTSEREARLRALTDEVVNEFFFGGPGTDPGPGPEEPPADDPLAADPLMTVEGVREVLARVPDIPGPVLQKLMDVAHDFQIHHRPRQEARALARDVEEAFDTCRRHALHRAVSQGADLTEEALLALAGSPECSLTTGVQAARRFTSITPLPDGAELGYPLG
ncbi:hypothetical protein [Actinomyces wuliandei]|uniref:hypothetical protein n=1 Tax=Actinomyces wuliandei TaxID=2057743 RepID=UPI0011196AA6|nr:hypothetical protein [Actinomyces wuliandei]